MPVLPPRCNQEKKSCCACAGVCAWTDVAANTRKDASGVAAFNTLVCMIFVSVARHQMASWLQTNRQNRAVPRRKAPKRDDCHGGIKRFLELLILLVGWPWEINTPLVVPVAPDLPPVSPRNFGRPGPHDMKKGAANVASCRSC